jgi:hypothetical protein
VKILINFREGRRGKAEEGRQKREGRRQRAEVILCFSSLKAKGKVQKYPYLSFSSSCDF